MPIRVLLYGNSLVLGGISASLQGESQFEVVRISHSLPDTSGVEALAPDVIVFDSEIPGSAAAFSALESHPDLIILGVSPDHNIVRLWSSREYSELSTKDLKSLIEVGRRITVSSNEQFAMAPDR